jgi:CcmD family protein
MENITFVVAAYAVFWGFTFAYVFSISRRQQNLVRDLKMLDDLMREEEKT